MRNTNMKHIVFFGICLMLAFLTGPVWAQEDWQRVERQIDEEKGRAEKDAALTERLVTMDRAAMQKEVARLKSEEKSKDRARNLLIKKYNEESHPFYCAARLWNDRVLKFSEIRDWLAMAFEVSLLKPIGTPSFGNFRF